MAEAAGTAIGAVSLGIQVCNGLIGYIDSARGAEERLTQISNQMDHLASILELLESVVSKLGDRQSVTQAREESVACSQALQKIREKLDSLHCRSRGPGCSIKERLKKFKKLAVFPFKEDGLLVCKNIVESVQGNLNTVLLVLNM
jgi:DNA repair ATPase RecN